MHLHGGQNHKPIGSFLIYQIFCLPISQNWDARLIWVNWYNVAFLFCVCFGVFSVVNVLFNFIHAYEYLSVVLFQVPYH